MKIRLQDLEKKILSLKELDLSRQEVLKRTRSYVDLCVDISTFQELKEIVFKHIPKKIFATAPRKLYEWVETKNEGVEHVHADYWKNLPKQVRFQILKWKRYKKTRLHDNDRPAHRNKGYQSISKDTINKGKDVYLVDKDSQIVIKTQKGDFFLRDVQNKIKSTIDRSISTSEAKRLYKKQHIPKPLVKKKLIRFKTVDSIAPERRFIKGSEQLYSLAYNPKTEKYDSNIDKAKDEDIIFENISWKLIPKGYKQYLTRKQTGMVLTENGLQQKRNFYHTTKEGKKIPKVIKLVDKNVIDYVIDKDRKAKRIEPPKPNTNKQLAKSQDRVKKERYKSHKLELSRNASRKNRIPKKHNKLRQSLLSARQFLQKLGILPKDTKDALTLRKEKTLKNRELRKQRRSFNAAKKLKAELKKNPNFIPLERKTKVKIEKVIKESKISDYKLKKSIKIKEKFQQRTESLRKHNLKKKFNTLRTYYKYKKEHAKKS